MIFRKGESSYIQRIGKNQLSINILFWMLILPISHAQHVSFVGRISKTISVNVPERKQHRKYMHDVKTFHFAYYATIQFNDI